MTTVPPASNAIFPASLDAEGRVAHALACRSCGYDLQGRRTEETCPECGTNVGASTRGDLLRFGDPRWVRGLALGILLMLIGQPLQFVVVLGGVLLTAFAPVLNWSVRPQTLTSLTGTAQVLCALAIVVGGWLLTAPDPTGMDRPLLRRLARGGLLFVVTLGPVGTFLQNSAMGGAGPAAPIMAVFFILSMLSLVGWIALLLHLRTLARRLPAPRFRTPLLVIAWAYAIATAMSSLTGFAVAFAAMQAAAAQGGAAGSTMGALPPGPLLVLVPLAALFFLAYLLAELAYITVLFLLRPKFARAAREAT